MSDFLDSELRGLSFVALYQLAAYHDKMATICRKEAATLQERAEGAIQIDRRLKYLETLPDTVAKYLRQGRSLETAQRMTAEHTQVPLATVEARWRAFVDRSNVEDKQKRNNLIMALAENLGLTNEEIAGRVGLKHPVSVSRIISKERRKNRIAFERAKSEGMAVICDEKQYPLPVPRRHGLRIYR